MSQLAPASPSLISQITGSGLPVTAAGASSIFSPITTGLGNVIQAIPQVNQLYFGVSFVNNRSTIYRIRLWSATVQNPNTASTLIQEYIFPLSPSNVTKQRQNLSAYYDVRSTPDNYGVQRIIDQYGQSPPIITISGTTGYQLHSQDGFKYTGRESILMLVAILQQYAVEVQNSVDNNTPMPSMDFSDGFTGESYEIVPFGQQTVTQDESRPIVLNYNLTFLAVSDLSQAITPSPDNLNAILTELNILSTAGFLSVWNSVLTTIEQEIGLV